MNSKRNEKLFSWIRDGKIKFKVVINKFGLFHYKLGYIVKNNGSVMSWSGSVNHTYKGLSGKNNEHFNFFKSEDICKDQNVELFINSWTGKLDNAFVLNIDNVLVSELSLQLKDEKVTILFLKEKWDNSIYYDGNCLNFITKNKKGTYFIPQAEWKESDFGYIADREFNKISVLNWIDRNEVFVPESTMKYLKDNISKMQKFVEMGHKIKNEWTEIKETQDFKDFIEDSKNLRRSPFDLQFKQSYFAYKLKKSLNFSVPGTGKTMVSLMTFNKMKINGEVKRLFVIGPTSSHDTWIQEFEDTFGYTPKSVNLSLMKSSNKDDKFNRISRINEQGYEIILMHFATAANYYHILKNILNANDLFIVDEAHYIKNNKGIWGESITKLGRKAKQSILLTGTPAANGVKDINNLISITYGDAFLNFFNLSRDKERLVSALMMRITYDDLNMKYKQVNHIIEYQLNDEQKEKAMILNNSLSQEHGSSFLETYIRKTQTLSSIELVFGNSYTKENSNKLNEMLNLIKKDKNIVIWAKFIKSIDSIEKAIKNNFSNIRVYKYYGQSNPNERVEAIKDYKKFGGVLIANPQTLAESVSLHKKTNYTIYFEYDFNLIHWLQSRNRTFRYGMENDMNYYVMMTSDDKVEEYVYKKLALKQDIQNALISYENDDIQEETSRDIRLFIEGMSI